MKLLRTTLLLFSLGYLALLALVFCLQRHLMYFPTHESSVPWAEEAGLKPWKIGGDYCGWAREVSNPRRVWLFIHCNGGQAAHRAWTLPKFSSEDSVYILEHPGYGTRPGERSKATWRRAAHEAYASLLATHGVSKLWVLGESLGSGPASSLAEAPIPPEHLVLLVPFDRLTDVAQGKIPWLPVRWLLRDRWDNLAQLRHYKGHLTIYGARHDEIIPVTHARTLAASVPGCDYRELDCGHNWTPSPEVNFATLAQ